GIPGLTVYGEGDGNSGIKNMRVGIGTSSPTALFTVLAAPTSYATNLFSISSTTAAGVVSTLYNITNTGNVGIGTTSPGSKLSVAGNEYISGTITSAAA